MIPVIYPDEQFIPAPGGNTSGISALAKRIYDWSCGEYERTGQPVKVGDIAYVFGERHRFTERFLVPQEPLTELVDESLIGLCGVSTIARINRESEIRRAELLEMIKRWK